MKIQVIVKKKASRTQLYYFFPLQLNNIGGKCFLDVGKKKNKDWEPVNKFKCHGNSGAQVR